MRVLQRGGRAESGRRFGWSDVVFRWMRLNLELLLFRHCCASADCAGMLCDRGLTCVKMRVMWRRIENSAELEARKLREIRKTCASESGCGASFPYPAMIRSLGGPRTALSARRTLSTLNQSLLLSSRRKVEASNSKASDQVGDLLAKRWLGGAAAKGNDTDRVRSFSAPWRGR